eukprot:Transcript_10371.p2 GENE.Transcript_10371~~Transcript_10371.p2  ORF type:complete len:239 (+),score=27.26 Transcript_10371:121-837(+)
MADALNYISVDDLSAEIQKHCDHEMLPSLLAELRGKQLDLKEFCKRVRMVIGASVLAAAAAFARLAEGGRLQSPACARLACGGCRLVGGRLARNGRHQVAHPRASVQPTRDLPGELARSRPHLGRTSRDLGRISPAISPASQLHLDRTSRPLRRDLAAISDGRLRQDEGLPPACRGAHEELQLLKPSGRASPELARSRPISATLPTLPSPEPSRALSAAYPPQAARATAPIAQSGSRW